MAGDTLDFVVNSEGNRNFDSTGFAVKISDQPLAGGAPEPASWALTLLGVAGLGWTLRVRRAVSALDI